MQTIFQLDANELNDQFTHRIRTFYAGRKVRIIIDEDDVPVAYQGHTATPTSMVQPVYQPPRSPADAEVSSLTNSLLFGRA
jgi:hypothetical protein